MIAKHIKINPKISIGPNHPVFTIAEIGKGFIQDKENKTFEQYLNNAKKLVKAAKKAGATAVKFQTHNLEDEQADIKVFSPHFSSQDRYNWVKKNDQITPLEFWQQLKKYCDQLDIIFFSSPMSRGAAQKLEKIGIDLWKVGSGDILDFVMLDYIASTQKPIIISFGMSNLQETDKTVNFLKKRNNKLILMHCVSIYPCPPENLNLGTIEFLQKRYKLPVGFSSHSTEWKSAVNAVNLGAVAIEKHFSFNRDLWGSDHKVSLTPDEFEQMVQNINNKTKFKIENYGKQNKTIHQDEKKFRPLFRKSLVAGKDIPAGTVLTKEMIYAMRPGLYIKGLPSEEYENILGKKTKKKLTKYQPITWNVIKNGQPTKVCFVITSKIHYGRSKILLQELKNRDDIELQIIVGASAIVDTYGDVLKLLAEDGFYYNAKIIMTLEGGSTVAMAKTAGIGITEFATAFDNLNPDIVLIRGDRYEVLSAAIAAAYLNITIAHIEGGDTSGTIDESVRHAITKLSHIHFSTNEKSKQRIIKMGENPEYVFNLGCLELEFVSKNNFNITNKYINTIGVGTEININQPYVIVMQHPVTSEIGHNRKHIESTIQAIYELNIPAIWFWPNVDAGTDEISKGIRVFREKHHNHKIRFVKHLPPEEFIALLKKANCLVGNSSAGIKECSYLGIPAVNIGTRQNKRLRADNVIDADYNQEQIKQAVISQLEHGPYMPSYIYYQPDTAKKISEILANITLYTQKIFFG